MTCEMCRTLNMFYNISWFRLWQSYSIPRPSFVSKDFWRLRCDSGWCSFSLTVWFVDSTDVDFTAHVYSDLNDGHWLVPGAEQTRQIHSYVPVTCSHIHEKLQPTSHWPEEGRHSRPHPRLSRSHSRWCSPRLSFWWRRSWLPCLWTGTLSHRWKPTCARNRENPLSAVSISDLQSTAAQPPDRRREGHVWCVMWAWWFTRPAARLTGTHVQPLVLSPPKRTDVTNWISECKHFY